MTARPLLRRLAGTLVAAALTLPVAHPRAEEPPKEYSAAERALFMSDQFAKLHPPTTLRYDFHHSGSLEPAFDDKVTIALKAQANGRCCNAEGDFLSGEHKVNLPAVEGAVGNPVTLFFLERDVREMQRLTTGKSAYFRKRIRMAIFQGAEQRSVSLRYRGKTISGTEFSIAPYTDDPNRPRFEKLVNKRYVFTLSDAVPGGIYAIHSRVTDTSRGDSAPPLLDDELVIEGGESSRQPTGT